MHPLAQRVVERAPAKLRPAMTVAVRTVVDALDDRIQGLAAEMAFYLVLSIAPLLVVVFAGLSLAGELTGTQAAGAAQAQAEAVARALLGEDAAGGQGMLGTLLDAAQRETRSPASALLSLGFVLTVLSASRALRVTTVAITIAYDLEDDRPTWKSFLYGLGLTVAAIVVATVAGPLLVAGPDVGSFLVETFGAPAVVADVWRLAYWPAAAVLATLLLAVLYHVAAPWSTPWRQDVPGAVLAMVITLLGSLGLRAYVDQAVDGAVLGSLAAPIVVLLWLYVVSFAVLLGAELNAEIERYSPPGRAAPDADRRAAADRRHPGGSARRRTGSASA